MRNTPGPWENDDNRAGFITARGGPDICEVFGESERAEECDFNQSLIKAAPELLPALKRLLQCYEEYPSGQYHGNEVIADCKAAIAKAEGRGE